MVSRIARSAGLPAFIEAVERDGCVIISDFTDTATLAQAKAEVQPYLDAEGPGSTVGALNGGTSTCTRLIGRSQTVREKFFSDSLYQDLAEHFLAIETTTYYGAKASTNTSHPLLSISITMDIRQGTAAQGLHRDDKNHHARHAPATKYTKGRDMLLGLFVPGCDTVEANGATRIIPGSHLWGDEKPAFGEDGSAPGVINAELKMGEAFVMLGSLYHGGGAYTRQDSKTRTVHIMFMCSGVYRQEEIPYLSYPIADVQTYSKLVQDRLGYKQSEPNLGWVDLKSPEFILEKPELAPQLPPVAV